MRTCFYLNVISFVTACCLTALLANPPNASAETIECTGVNDPTDTRAWIFFDYSEETCVIRDGYYPQVASYSNDIMVYGQGNYADPNNYVTAVVGGINTNNYSETHKHDFADCSIGLDTFQIHIDPGLCGEYFSDRDFSNGDVYDSGYVALFEDGDSTKVIRLEFDYIMLADQGGNQSNLVFLNARVTGIGSVSLPEAETALPFLITDTTIETAVSVVANIEEQISVIRTGGESAVQGTPQQTQQDGLDTDADGLDIPSDTDGLDIPSDEGVLNFHTLNGAMDLGEFLSSLKFHLSVNSLFRDDDWHRLSATEDGTTPSSIPGGPPDGGDLSEVGTLSLWGLGSWTSLENERNDGTTDSRYDGDIFTYSLGSDYRFTEELAAGLALSLSTTDIDTTFNQGTLEEEAYLVSPYLSYETDAFSLSVVGGYGVGEVDLTGNEETVFVANTDSTTLFLQGGIQNTYRFGESEALELTPGLSALAARKTLDAYQDSAGRDIEETVSNVFRLTPDIKAGYRYDFTGGAITPYLQGGMILDLLDSVNDDDGAYSVGGGVTLSTDGGLTSTLDYEREIGRDDFERQTVTGAIRYGLDLSPADTITPTVEFYHDQEDGMRQSYGLDYRRQQGAHRLDLGIDMDRGEESDATFGSSMGYTWSPMDNATLSGSVRSQDLQERDYGARLQFNMKF